MDFMIPTRLFGVECCVDGLYSVSYKFKKFVIILRGVRSQYGQCEVLVSRANGDSFSLFVQPHHYETSVEFGVNIERLLLKALNEMVTEVDLVENNKSTIKVAHSEFELPVKIDNSVRYNWDEAAEFLQVTSKQLQDTICGYDEHSVLAITSAFYRLVRNIYCFVYVYKSSSLDDEYKVVVSYMRLKVSASNLYVDPLRIENKLVKFTYAISKANPYNEKQFIASITHNYDRFCLYIEDLYNATKDEV